MEGMRNMENKELFILFLQQGDEVVYQNTTCKKGIILENYKNGQFKVRNSKGIEETINVEEIIFSL